MSDEQLPRLMAAYQQGDAGAFDGLYRALRPRLHQYLSMLARSRSLADDLLQETFLHLHRSRRTYSPGRPVAPWAFAIARHVYLMDVRKQSRLREKELVPDDHVPDVPVPPEAEHLAERLTLQRALAQLSPDQVEAVTLHHVWGFTFQEIGAVLGILPVTAKLRAFRGMTRLRTILGVEV